MKFHQVPLGQRFEFEGKWYIKSRPLTATHEASGETRIIRRSADVTLPGVGASAAPPPQVLETTAVRAAFEEFYARCVACLETLRVEQNTEQLSAARARIEAARGEFLKTLSRQ